MINPNVWIIKLSIPKIDTNITRKYPITNSNIRVMYVNIEILVIIEDTTRYFFIVRNSIV